MARRPRIAVLGEKFFPSRGGTSRIVESTVRHLAGRYDFTVYCYPHPEAATHLPGVQVVTFPRPRLKGIGVFLYYARCMLHARRSDFDLVHVHKLDASFALPFLARRVPCVATCHEVPYLNSKWSGLARAYFRRVEQLFVRSRATHTCVSLEQQRHFRERFGLEVEYVPNGVDEPAFDEAGAEALLRGAGVTGDFLLFAARRIIPLKGAHTLIEALHRISFGGTLVILGDLDHAPAYCEELRTKARGLDVRFLGYVEDPATLMGVVQEASTFVFPSEREGMSVMLLEVATSGTPILCSDICQNTDVLDGTEAVLFRSEDAEHLAAQLRWMEENPGEVSGRTERAKRKVFEQFSSASVAELYGRLYDRVLGKGT